MKKAILENQILNSAMLCFDPINKVVQFDPVKGKKPYEAIHYVDVPRAIEILDNGDTVFRFRAPDAGKVQVAVESGAMGGRKFDMAKDRGDWWSVTVADIPAGYHWLRFYVDGTMCMNPDAPIGIGGGFCPINFLEKPDEDWEFYLLKDDVPHGDIRMELYKSSVTGRVKACWVYTPPMYDQMVDRHYPVLYIQHGVCENETSWIWQGKLNLIVDNLLAESKCKEMLIVMNCGYAFKEGDEPVFFPGDFDTELVKDCIPFIDQKYRTLSDRKGRAVAGLSLGSAQAYLSGMKHPDLFASVAIFSGGLTVKRAEYDFTAFYADPANFARTYDVFFVSCGEQEGYLDPLTQRIGDLNGGGAGIHFYHHPGYHIWDVWRFSLRELLPLLFRETGG